MIRWVALLLALAAPASAQRAIMEGVAASRYTVKVDTVNARVLIDTTSYTGGIPNTGLFVASNVVVGTLTQKNACVIYATGSVTCLGVVLGPGESNTYTSSKTFTGDVLIGSSSTASAFFGDGSHLTGIGEASSYSQSARTAGFTSGAVGNVCIATITVTGSTFTVHANIAVIPTNAGTVVFGYLVDGSCPTGMTCSATIGAVKTPWVFYQAEGVPVAVSINSLERLVSGSHSLCIYAANDVGSSSNARNFYDFWVEYK